jgi:hypothetical protein
MSTAAADRLCDSGGRYHEQESTSGLCKACRLFR